MKNIQQKIIEKVGIDRLLHFAFGGWVACIASEWYYALLIGFIIGLAKELFDKYIKKSRFDWLDLLATFAGSVVTAIGMLMLLVIAAMSLS